MNFTSTTTKRTTFFAPLMLLTSNNFKSPTRYHGDPKFTIENKQRCVFSYHLEHLRLTGPKAPWNLLSPQGQDQSKTSKESSCKVLMLNSHSALFFLPVSSNQELRIGSKVTAEQDKWAKIIFHFELNLSIFNLRAKLKNSFLKKEKSLSMFYFSH